LYSMITFFLLGLLSLSLADPVSEATPAPAGSPASQMVEAPAKDVSGVSSPNGVEESEEEKPPADATPQKKKKPKAAPTPPPIPEGVRFEKDVPYLPEGRNEKADLYMPSVIPEGARLPAVLIIHGGGFNDGDKTKSREINIGTNLALNGYLAMSINYKLRKAQGQVTWPQNVQDCKSAVRWLRANAERLHVDPDRIGVIGGSAGGNLAGMVAMTRPEDGLEPQGVLDGYPSGVRCAVIMYGAVDLMNLHDFKMFNKTRAEDPDVYKKASPITYARSDAPPILILHGTADKVVDVSQSRTLDEVLTTAGSPHELMIIPDAPHTFELQSFMDLRPKVIGFFDKYLKGNP
jgi:acetyl esterase/lipase